MWLRRHMPSASVHFAGFFLLGRGRGKIVELRLQIGVLSLAAYCSLLTVHRLPYRLLSNKLTDLLLVGKVRDGSYLC